jgi:orotidine-5'-phosphate decarboxylase
MKKIETNKRLILALDVPTKTTALKFLDDVGDSISTVKIGLELITTGYANDVIRLCKNLDIDIFWDAKYYDIPETVTRSCRVAASKGVKMITVHAAPGNITAALKGVEGTDTKIIAVTVLTSHDLEELKLIAGYETSALDLVHRRAAIALKEGVHGIVCSGQEASYILNIGHTFTDKDILIITPGIRDYDSPADDQNRSVTVEEALRSGADYLVIGRPIRNAVNRKEAALIFQKRIENYFTLTI